MTSHELWSPKNRARPESVALRRYAFGVSDPLRDDVEDAWLKGFRAALRACGMDPGWDFVERDDG